MTKARELVPCAACGRVVYDWRHLTLQLDGKTIVDTRLCRLHATQAEDALLRSIREVS